MRSQLAVIKIIFFSMISLIVACSDSHSPLFVPDSSDSYLPIANPLLEDPPNIGNPYFVSKRVVLAEVGYQQREFFLSGTTNAFTNLNELKSDGFWEVEPSETADYKTRILVHRPIDPADFSGTVLVEWINVFLGFELRPSWDAGHTGMLREGHIWIGVSAQLAGIEGSVSSVLPRYLKAANPERYESLLHPGDSFSYDIYSQVAQAIRHPSDVNVLDGLQAEQILAVGDSDSADRLVTYINAVHPLYNPYDGYMIHSRGDGSSALTEEPLVAITTPEALTVRTDLNVPVMSFQTETDLFVEGALDGRQEDSDSFRLWEVAGSAHSDYYLAVSGRDDKGADPAFAVVVEEDTLRGGFITCGRPLNAGPHPWVFNAAVDALVKWARDGTQPPTADRLAITDDKTAFRLDEFGNVLGGIRTSYVDTPAAILSGEGQEGFCFLNGTTELFDPAQMVSLYVDKAGYVQAVSDATDEAVDKGFLLPPDAKRIKAAASLQWDMLKL